MGISIRLAISKSVTKKSGRLCMKHVFLSCTHDNID